MRSWQEEEQKTQDEEKGNQAEEDESPTRQEEMMIRIRKAGSWEDKKLRMSSKTREKVIE